MADERTYIRVHDGIEDHPKTAALSDKAFRLLVTTWGWCSRHRTDGRVPVAVWKKRGTKGARDELERAGLVEPGEGHMVMHDYLEHQRSAELIAEKVEAKKRGARLGNHRRWHEERGIYDPACEFCLEDAPPEPPDPSDKRSDTDRFTDASPDQNFGNETNLSNANDVHLCVSASASSTAGLTVHNGPASGNTDRTAIAYRSRSDRKTSPETETETEKRRSEGDSRSSLPVGVARERGVSGPHSTAAARLVSAAIGRHVPSAVRTALAFEVARLWPEATPDELAEALRRWDSRTGIGPALLPSLLADIRKEARGATARAAPAKSPTDQFAEQFLAAGHRQPDLRALPGGA